MMSNMEREKHAVSSIGRGEKETDVLCWRRRFGEGGGDIIHVLCWIGGGGDIRCFVLEEGVVALYDVLCEAGEIYDVLYWGYKRLCEYPVGDNTCPIGCSRKYVLSSLVY